MPQSSSPDPLESELAHYRERWKATMRLSDQRVTMLLTTLGSAVAISAAVIVHGSSPTLDSRPLLSGLWAIVALVSEGIFLRLIRVRRSIARDVNIINRLRSAIYADVLDAKTRTLLQSIHSLDSNPPKVFELSSTCSAAAPVAAGSALCAAWLADSGIAHAPPSYAYLVGATALALNMFGYYWVGRRISKRYRPAEN